MTDPLPRIWTLKELDSVHPLDDVGDDEHWEWIENGVDPKTGVQLWAAVVLDHDYGEPEVTHLVCVDDRGRLDVHMADTDEPPADVCLAVILASKGLDSLGAMADELDGRAAKAFDSIGDRDWSAEAARHEGRGDALEECAAMLRRGTVAP